MELEIWGATTIPYLTAPERTSGSLLLAAYALLLGLIIYQRRHDFGELTQRSWLLTGMLAIASVVASQLFLISITSDSQLPPLASAQNPVSYLAPFSFAPFLLAGAILNPLSALLVGFSAGLGRALWQTHQLTDPVNFALAAVVAAYLMRQNYSGWLYAFLRHPLTSGGFCGLLLLPLIGVATFVYADPSASNLEALDLALSNTSAYFWPMLIGGLFGGVIVLLILIGLPQLRPKRQLASSPLSHSLDKRLVATFLLFAVVLSFLLILLGFNLAVRLVTNQTVGQMAKDALAVTSTIPTIRAHRQNLLNQTSENDALLSDDPQERQSVLNQLFHSGAFFKSLILIDDSQSILAHYPENLASDTLTDLESSAIENTLLTGSTYISPAQESDDSGFFLSFIVPLMDDENQPVAVLLGRVPNVNLDELVTALQGTLGQGTGFILDEQDRIIGHPDPAYLLKRWNLPPVDRTTLNGNGNYEGFAYESLQGSTNARQLVYYLPGPDHPWPVVITMPYEVVLEQALQITAQLTIVLLVAMLLIGIFLLLLGRSITRPLTDLVGAAQRITGGSLNTPIDPQGDDEIGRLGFAFGQMQLSLKRRLDELSLLLDVSQDVSKSIDINKGMPTVLKGALRGTGASGARVVVLNPSGRQPLTFGQGPASSTMAPYDRQVMNLIQQHEEMVISEPSEVHSLLKNGQAPDTLPKAMIALPLATNGRLQGIFWLSYRQAHTFDQTELTFLRTLSGQASVLVENARLYATAEGGRRRLAAVLSSTSDAVIVTDQTERILLINPAMERFFDLKGTDVVGRPIKAIIDSEPLIEALTASYEKTYNVEVPVGDDTVLYASASTIFNNEGQAIGRVAVLHDITYLKEIDEMKSEFVNTVSHDLRTPLTYMLGYATMLPMSGNLEPRQEEYIKKIVGGIEQMSELVNDLLDLGRLEAGVDLILAPLRVKQILDSVSEQFRQPAKINGIELVVNCPQYLPLVIADGSLIRQAVGNYVDNAIKYAAGSSEVMLTAAHVGDEVIIGVRDHGPGISNRDTVRVFEKFHQIKERGVERTQGSGLGLALVKSIAERHHGRAWCESKLGVGSVFYLALPAGELINKP